MEKSHGIELGMKITDKQINSWVMTAKNFFDEERGYWGVTAIAFIRDREVTKFSVKEGHIAFQVSDTSKDIWIKAEGFMEHISGWKIGDVLTEKNIKTWRKEGKNILYDENTLVGTGRKFIEWEYSEGACIGDRKVKDISIKNGEVALLVSGTSGVWLRAEGFKDFIEEGKLKEDKIISGWYRATILDQLVFKSKAEDNNYGFVNNNWRTGLYCSALGSAWVKADTEEVEESLIREAKKRGLVIGAYYNSLPYEKFNAHKETEIDNYYYHEDINILCSCFGVMFDNGVWAQPLINTLPKVNGYKGEDKGDYIQYGCAKLNKTWFSISYSRYIESLTLSSGVKLSKKDVNAIREYIKR